MPTVLGSAHTERKLRQRDTAGFAARLAGDKRAGTAAALGHIEYRSSEPTGRHTTECCIH